MVENMVAKKTWNEFRDSKLLWWVNRSLHIFGWAIVVQIEDSGEISDCYPARVKFRGFDEKNEADGFIGLSTYLETEASTLAAEARE